MSSSATESSKMLRVGLCQFHVTNDKTINHKTCIDYIQNAASQGAKLVVLPEIWNSPYATLAFPDYAEVAPSIHGSPPDASVSPSAALLQEQAQKHNIWLVGGSIPEVSDDGKYYNTCLVFDPNGVVVAKHRKMHLFDIDVPGKITFFESDTLTAGDSVSTFTLEDGTMVGVGICYDIRFAEYAMLLEDIGCQILIYPGAFNMTTGPLHWELLQRGRANDNQCFVLTASPARTIEEDAKNNNESKYPHYTAWGHSTVVSPWAKVIATTDEKEGVVMADLDLTEVEQVRSAIPVGKQKRTDIYTLVKPTRQSKKP
jgi:omega-amidase